MADDGSATTFRSFMVAEHGAILAFARAVAGSWAEAEDLTQEAFLVAFERWGEVSAYDKPGAFVRRVVANKSVSGVRRRVRAASALRRLAPRDHHLDDDVADPAFWTAVAALPPQQRHVVALYYLEDRPVSEIAEVLGRAEGTVKAHLAAARRNLAAVLGSDMTEEER